MSDIDEILRLLLYVVSFFPYEYTTRTSIHKRSMCLSSLFLFYRRFYATIEAQPAFCLRFFLILLLIFSEEITFNIIIFNIGLRSDASER